VAPWYRGPSLALPPYLPTSYKQRPPVRGVTSCDTTKGSAYARGGGITARICTKNGRLALAARGNAATAPSARAGARSRAVQL
jgi:hypothetical protein